MKSQKEEIEYWAECTLLKERGWSKGRISKLLKEPDKLVPNPHYSKAPKMRLYARSRVLEAEASPEFVAFRTSAPNRAEKSETQRRQRRQLLINRLSCPSHAPLAVYEEIVTRRFTPFNEPAFPEAFCRDMPEKLWLALSPRPEFEAEAIEIVVLIVLAALDTIAARRGQDVQGFEQVERVFEIWRNQLNLETGAGVEAFAHVFADAIAPDNGRGHQLTERRGYALDRLNQISTRQWSVGPSFFQEQISRGDEWLYFAR
jgi:hypothetical protein